MRTAVRSTDDGPVPWRASQPPRRVLDGWVLKELAKRLPSTYRPPDAMAEEARNATEAQWWGEGRKLSLFVEGNGQLAWLGSEARADGRWWFVLDEAARAIDRATLDQAAAALAWLAGAGAGDAG